MLSPEREKDIRGYIACISLGHPTHWSNELLAEIDRLRDYAKHLQSDLGDSIEYQGKLREELAKVRMDSANAILDLTKGWQKELDQLQEVHSHNTTAFNLVSEERNELKEKLRIAEEAIVSQGNSREAPR